MKINFPKIGVVSLAEHRREVHQLQHTVEILLAEYTTRSSRYTGNPYLTYDSAIDALGKKYEGTTDWGCHQTQNIVDLRAAFTIGQGIKAIEKNQDESNQGQYQAEMDFINSFIDHNDINEEMAQEWAKEAELEGRTLFRLFPNKEKKNIDLRWISYSDHKYKIGTAPEDYKKYTKAEYKLPNKTETVTLEPDSFVYKKFSGRVNKVNEIMPKAAKILRHLEDLDKALWDLRRINHLFASPTPYMKVANEDAADALRKTMQDIKWNIGKLLVTTAEFNLVEVAGQAVESIIKEIVALAKIISGATGIPVHFLGLPDLMSNRAVSTDLFELISASTNKERRVWIGGYEEIFQKAIRMYNVSFGKALREDTVGADVIYITEQKLNQLVSIWLPLFRENAIDLKTMVEKIPDANYERIKAEADERARGILESMRSMDNNPDDDGGQDQ